MSSQTKILVIHMKELIIGLVVAVALVILTILAILCFGGKSDQPTAGNATATKPANGAASSGNPISNTYNPGVYTSSISVNGTPMEIQVTVDANNINAIELNNLSESITTMYPMIQSSFQEVVAQVIKSGGTENVTYPAENKYTSTLLLQGIAQALEKCTVH